MDLDFFSSPNHRKSYFFGFKHIKTQKWTQWVLLEKVISHPQPSHTQTETQTVEANHLLDHWGINKPHLFYISPPPQLLVIIFSPFHPLFVLDFPLTPSSLQLPSLFFADSLQLMPQKNKPNYKTAITGTTAKRSKVKGCGTLPAEREDSLPSSWHKSCLEGNWAIRESKGWQPKSNHLSVWMAAKTLKRHLEL